MSADQQRPSEVVHDCPREGESVALCCGRTPFDLPRSDRLTLDAALVTCTGRPSGNDHQEQAR